MKIVNKLKDNYLLVIIIFLAAVLRLYHLDYQSIWLDEIITMKECNPKLSFNESYEIMKIWENNPIIYYYLVKINSMIFGHSTIVVRGFSAIIGVLCVYLFYLIGKEISEKKTGLIAALLASINFFLITYSQEARAYILITFFTILSFYQLIKFLKNNTIKRALIYGLTLTLLINTHFFGLFVLVSQVVILFVFLFDIENKEKLSFIFNSSLAGVVAIFIWYFISWDMFKIASEIKAFWIPQPSTELITGVFKEFFGNNEAILFLSTILVIFYFIRLFTTNFKTNTIKNNPLLFGFSIFSIWIFITIFIPYLRSYLQIPMITSRYLIVVLPAILLLLSVSISNIESKIIRNTILGFFIIFSLTALLVVKKYYTQITKTQYREITNKILEKNTTNNKIISSWGWHISYFFNSDPKKDVVVYKSLQTYVNELMNSTEKKEAFWYMDAHFTPYNLSAEAEKFLQENYNIVENLEYYDTWAKFYVPKANIENTFNLNINEFEPVKSDNNLNILLFSNSTTNSPKISLEKGMYTVAIKAKSIPDPPINNENAHLSIDLNGNKIGSYFVNEKSASTTYFKFQIDKKQDVSIGLTFGNDLVLDNNDRNVLIFSVVVEKNKY